jgi:hypothetical protein
VLLVALTGWSFAAAEFVGGPLMIAILVVLFRPTRSPRSREKPYADLRNDPDCRVGRRLIG